MDVQDFVGCGSAYVTDSLQRVMDVQSSAVIFVSLLIVLVTRRATLGDRAFPVVIARAWNALPDRWHVVQRWVTMHFQLSSPGLGTPYQTGDTSCNAGWPCISSRHRPGLERPTRLVTRRAMLGDHAFPVVIARAWNALPDCHVGTYLLIIPYFKLRWRRICFPEPSDTDNMHH